MIAIWWRWFWTRIIGVHVCEEFTQWDDRSCWMNRAATGNEAIYGGWGTVKYVRRWQERRCTVCGRIQQRELKIAAAIPQPSEVPTDGD